MQIMLVEVVVGGVGGGEKKKAWKKNVHLHCAVWVYVVNLKHLSLEMSFSIKCPGSIYISCIQVNLRLPCAINHCHRIAVSVPLDITLVRAT